MSTKKQEPATSEEQMPEEKQTWQGPVPDAEPTIKFTVKWNVNQQYETWMIISDWLEPNEDNINLRLSQAYAVAHEYANDTPVVTQQAPAQPQAPAPLPGNGAPAQAPVPVSNPTPSDPGRGMGPEGAQGSEPCNRFTVELWKQEPNRTIKFYSTNTNLQWPVLQYRADMEHCVALLNGLGWDDPAQYLQPGYDTGIVAPFNVHFELGNVRKPATGERWKNVTGITV